MATTRRISGPVLSCIVLLSSLLITTVSLAQLSANAVIAAKNNDTQFIHKQIPQNPALAAITDEQGYTPLHWAAIRGNWEIFQWLLDSDAPVNIKGGDGGTPLHWACHHDRADMVALLLEHDADLSIHNRWGRVPLHVAVRRNCQKVAQLLIDQGADPNVTTREGWTALHIAQQAGWPEMAKLLIAAGADVDLKDNQGNRPDNYSFNRPAPISKTPVELSKYTGQYDLGSGLGFKVWLTEGQLYLREFAPDLLYPVADDVFYCRQEPWVVKFERDDSGQIATINVKFLRRTVVGQKAHTAQYVGSKECRECHIDHEHGNQYVNWLSSKHAMAYWQLNGDWAKFLAGMQPHYADITKPHQEHRCLMCHVTGAQNPDAFYSRDFSETEGVGCESCHGPGSDYIDEDIMSDRDQFLSHGGQLANEQTCKGCHRRPDFSFDTYWHQVKHSLPEKH